MPVSIVTIVEQVLTPFQGSTTLPRVVLAVVGAPEVLLVAVVPVVAVPVVVGDFNILPLFYSHNC